MDAIAITAHGKLRGISQEGVLSYLGVPFAASPDGARRFAEPEPLAAWEGIRDANEFGPSAPQNADEARDTMFDQPPHQCAEAGSLTLNVWCPERSGAPRPVMVWIHGGAFLLGTGSDPSHSGHRLAVAHDVVVVTINYRLGALGFLSTEGVPDNLGLRDQVAALEWVRHNIEAFGGDPGNVTIFGQSAGAMSAVCLLAAPAAAGLFHRVIVQSGNAEFAVGLDTYRERCAEFLGMLGVSEGDLSGLREISVNEILRVQAVFEREMELRGVIAPFGPVIDGEWLPEQPLEAIRKGSGGRVPVLLGHNLHEGRMFTELVPIPLPQADQLDAAFAAVFSDPRAARSAYAASERWGGEADIFAALLGDELFAMPTERLAEALVSSGHPTWRYRFDWCSNARGGALGACHSLEIPFVFNLLNLPGLERFTGEHPPQQLADLMSRIWTDFARVGLLGWEAFELSTRTSYVFDNVSAACSDPGKERRELWGRYR